MFSYVLWVDADNRQLMKAFYPEYLEIYDSLPKEIYRADMVSFNLIICYLSTRANANIMTL